MILVILVFETIFSASYGQGFLRTSGKKIVDESGTEVILRSMGLGGWMLQEGYMLQSADVANTQHLFRQKVEQLVGTAVTDSFYNAWIDETG